MDKINEFKELLIRRDSEFRKQTELLFDAISPVIDLLYELFQLPVEDVLWSELEVTDDALVLTASITFAPDAISPFVATFAPADVANDPDVAYVEQVVRIGIPLPIAFGSEDDLRHFFDNLPVKQMTDTQPPEEDLTDLTDDQIERLRMFERSTSGAKH